MLQTERPADPGRAVEHVLTSNGVTRAHLEPAPAYRLTSPTRPPENRPTIIPTDAAVLLGRAELGQQWVRWVPRALKAGVVMMGRVPGASPTGVAANSSGVVKAT